MTIERMWGKYRGIVVNTIDPEQRGRILTIVPDVGPAVLTWALPCLPGAGPGTGFFVLPPVGASVWVEFERGDVDYPIWTGGYWSSAADLPAGAGPSAWRWSRGALRIEMSDDPGAERLVLSCGDGKITLSAEGVAIEGPLVQL
ncbi:MAG TPA: phage baseplate assembly protein V [Allosphingosinicella sp.]|nr:phage baseplate assembly protein V [Allosphingosinicella sp.]